jgi:hypothetical protein
MEQRASTLSGFLLLSLLSTRALPSATGGDPARRVLHLQNGDVVRARTRRAESGAWEFEQRGAWKAIPAEFVARAVDERELLARAAELSAELGATADPNERLRRVAYSQWLVEEGLYVEALSALDQVLAVEPALPEARALLREHARELTPLPLAAAADPQALLTAGAKLTPSGRALAIELLAATATPEEQRAALNAVLTSPREESRSLAALGLGLITPGEALEPLLVRAILDGSPAVREAATRSLVAADEPALAGSAAKALWSTNLTVRTNSADFLAALGAPSAVEPLIASLAAPATGGGSGGSARGFFFAGKQKAYVQDFDVEVATGESIADPVVNVLQEGVVLDVRTLAISTSAVVTWEARARRALESLTGERPGAGTVKDWARWWELNGAEWKRSHALVPATGE